MYKSSSKGPPGRGKKVTSLKVKNKKKKGSGKFQKSLERRKKSVVNASKKMLRGLQKATNKNQKRYSINDEMLEKIDIVLPPSVPDSIDGTNTKDISMFATTWDMKGLTAPPTKEQISYWLPLGYDVYVVALQTCRRIASIVPTCIEHLEKKFERYEQYTHFLPVENEASINESSALVLLIFVHTSCLEERVFRKRSPHMVHLREDRKNSENVFSFKPKKKAATRFGGSAITVEFDVFDTRVLVINCQLTHGAKLAGERITDMKNIMKLVNESDVDHVVLLGDLASSNNGDGYRNYISEYINILNPGVWEPKMFQNLSRDYDEVSTVMKAAVPEFKEFREIAISYPPTNHRIVKHRKRVTKEALAELFHKTFDFEGLYDSKSEEGLPAYPNRIFWNTRDRGLRPCLKHGQAGTLEGLVGATTVPVFTTFRIGSRSFGAITNEKKSRFAQPTKAPAVPTPAAVPANSIKDDAPPPPPRDYKKKNKKESFGDEYLKEALGKLMQSLNKSNNPTQGNEQPSKHLTELHAEDVGVCNSCYAPIEGGKPHYEASDKVYHKGCFNCVFCDSPITKKYYMIDENLYCETDYMDLFNPVCQGDACGERIDGPFVKTEIGAYHPDCFKCNLCDVALAEFKDGAITSQDFCYRRKELLCIEHGAEMDGRTCVVCDEIIVDDHAYETIVNSGEMLDLHKDCFKCFECGKYIAEQEELSYLIKNGKVLCAEHGGMLCGSCNSPISNSTGYTQIVDTKYHSYCTPSCMKCNKLLGSDCIKKADGMVCVSCEQGKKERTNPRGKPRTSVKRPTRKMSIRISTMGPRDKLPSFDGFSNLMVESGPAVKRKTEETEATFILKDERVPRISLMSFSGYDIAPPPPPDDDEYEDDSDYDFFAPPPPPPMEDDPPPYDASMDMDIDGMMNELANLTAKSKANSVLRPSKYMPSHRDSDNTTLPPIDFDDESVNY